jgi:N-acetyl sugar amidotransferase
MEKDYQVCTRCIMDTSDPEIIFDENGVCNHCKLYDSQAQYIFTEDKLKEVVAKIKKQSSGKEYDCLIGLSGGVDSCMSAYLAKKAGLNPLAVHIDNGWNSEVSQSNLERTLKKLDIDLFTHVIDWEEFKDLQRSFLYASVPNIDYPYDHAILALLFNKAAELGLQYIIFGTNITTEFIMPRAWGYNSWDSKHLRAIHNRFGKLNIDTSPTISLWNLGYYSALKKIRIFRILDYVNYNKKEAKEFLKKEFCWKDYGGKHCESVYTRFFIGYVLPKKFGFDRNRAWMSTLILSGQMTRDEALNELAKGFYSSNKELEDEKDYVIKKLEISTEEFERIMSLPVRRHTDYPNNSLFLDRSGYFVRFARKFLRKL